MSQRQGPRPSVVIHPQTLQMAQQLPQLQVTETATPITTNDLSLYTTTQTDDLHRETTTREDTTDTPTAPDRLPDRAPRARPHVDYQDMLWTQIDILDDVRRMAEQTSSDRSFFSEEHAKALAGLRETQNALLGELKKCEKTLDSVDDHKVVWDSTGIESVRERLYNREYFDAVKERLAEVKVKLDDVGKSMEKVDKRADMN